MLTSRTLCPVVGVSPARPSRVAAAAAAAMPPWLTPRDARAVGIPGMDSPGGIDEPLIGYTEVKLYKNAGLGNEKGLRSRRGGSIVGLLTCSLLDGEGWWEGMSATIRRSRDYTRSCCNKTSFSIMHTFQ